MSYSPVKDYPAARTQPPAGPAPKVAYIMSRFPKLTETFVLFEILAVADTGVQVELYPLMRARNTAVHAEGASVWTKLVERLSKPSGDILMHPEARPLVERAHFHPFLSWPVLRAQFHFLARKPRAYFGTLWTLIRENLGSANFLAGSLAIFPKTVYSARLMQQEGITHVHAHFANHPTTAAYIVHRLTGIPFSFTAHGSDLHVDRHMLCEKVKEASAAITISNYNHELIVSTCGEAARDKVRVIHCGVDTEIFQPPAAARSDETVFNILCIGTMYEVKGHKYLVDACRLLKERGVSFQCRLVGDGPFRDSLAQQISDSSLGGEVHLLGQKTREEIAALLQQADVLTLPSIPTDSGRREGIPVVLMEAMSSGLPVVASGISGIPELVRDEFSGLLVPPRDPAALADALQRLIESPELSERLGNNARNQVLEEFDQRANAARLARLFNQEAIF